MSTPRSPLPFHTGGRSWQSGALTVVLLHGGGMDHTVWQGQSRALAHGGYNVAALNLPGHGDAPDAPTESVEDLARWLDAVLLEQSVARAALVGHSIGAAVALTHAGLFPERTAALALLGCGLQMPVSLSLLADLKRGALQGPEFIAAFAQGRPSHLQTAPGPGGWQMGSALTRLRACDPAVLRRDFEVCNAWSGAAYAAQAACPTLVLAGEVDRMTPARNGRALAEAIAGAQYQELPAIGHMMHTEAPRQVLRLLREFLAGVAR